ncbi:GNAT family N-acetyltransferase [Tumebacillus flagellatus]|uniref:N-acetyltransferase domain-containing protein n=1 Tax=Tumebacillus flagellatus TaxID=1157490 RepID=A0A074LJ16_9BACL|nr:GNAT family N-acetyltransferase [Tumebacillus flagellatus]KEO82161.1 hypothetical protein EL26_16615 [Tumebacillus flagellatus]
MKIRMAEEGDHMFLVREYLQYFSPHIEEAKRYAELNLTCDRTWLMEEDGLILGTLSWGAREGVHSGIAQLTGLRIIPSRRRQGLAGTLLQAGLEDMASYFADRAASLRRVFAFAPEDQPGAGPLLQAYGFHPLHRLDGWREDGVGEWFYVR